MKRLYALLPVALAALLLGGLSLVFKSSAADRGAGHPLFGTYRLLITDQRPDAEPTVFRVRQGDPVTLLITTDRPGSVNVHGYEKEVVLQPGGEVTLPLTAARTGRYRVHLHGAAGSHREVAALEVHPR